MNDSKPGDSARGGEIFSFTTFLDRKKTLGDVDGRINAAVFPFSSHIELLTKSLKELIEESAARWNEGIRSIHVLMATLR